MSQWFKSQIEEKAELKAREYTVNEDKRQAFIDGAKFAIERLCDVVRPHAMEDMMDRSTKKMVDGLTLNSVREAIYSLANKVPDQENKP